MSRKVIFILMYFIAHKNKIDAQTHNEFWSKLSVSKTVKSNWVLSADLNYRQQVNYRTDSKNILLKPLLRSIRLWVNYSLKKNYSIVLSPLFVGVNMDVTNKVGALRKNKEFRFAVGVGKKILFKKISLKSRLLYEPRFIQPIFENHFIQHRYRLFTGFIIPLKTIYPNNKIVGLLSNEFFCHTQNLATAFEQNRIQIGMQWHFKATEFALTYQFTNSNNNNGLSVQKNQYLFALNFYL